jgi:hypothetical protein
MKYAYSVPNIESEIIATADATIAVMFAVIDGKEYRWTGTAKRVPEDKFVPEIGAKLALGRALEKAGRQLQRQANGFVKSMDDNAVHSAQAREARKKESRKAVPVRTSRVAKPAKAVARKATSARS